MSQVELDIHYGMKELGWGLSLKKMTIPIFFEFSKLFFLFCSTWNIQFVTTVPRSFGLTTSHSYLGSR
jgi:hypothetical protein